MLSLLDWGGNAEVEREDCRASPQHQQNLLFAVTLPRHLPALLSSSENHRGRDLSTSKRLSFWVLGQRETY